MAPRRHTTGGRGEGVGSLSAFHRTADGARRGGASVLKRRGADPVLSEHGKWRREHLGAWNAAYGRTPFFPYLMPQIEEVYRRSEGMTLGEFTAALLDVAVSWIEPEVLRADGEMIQAVRTETDVKVDRSLSIFDAIFRLGKESAFAL